MANKRGNTKPGRRNAPNQSKAGNKQPKIRYIFDPKERWAQISSSYDTCKSGEKTPSATVRVPFPDYETDPDGAHVLGWRMIAKCTDDNAMFETGTGFVRTLTFAVKEEDRPKEGSKTNKVLTIIGEPNKVYSVMFTRQVASVVDSVFTL